MKFFGVCPDRLHIPEQSFARHRFSVSPLRIHRINRKKNSSSQRFSSGNEQTFLNYPRARRGKFSNRVRLVTYRESSGIIPSSNASQPASSRVVSCTMLELSILQRISRTNSNCVYVCHLGDKNLHVTGIARRAFAFPCSLCRGNAACSIKRRFSEFEISRNIRGQCSTLAGWKQSRLVSIVYIILWP